MTQTTEAPEASSEIKPDAALVSLIKQGIDKVEKGKVSLAELIGVTTDQPAVRVVASPQPVANPTSISDEERIALTRLPEVFGVVNPDTVRELDSAEIEAIATERRTIDIVLGFLDTRKTAEIREIIANHFDAKAVREGLVFAADVLDDDGNVIHEATPRDDKGHFVLKQKEPVGDSKDSFVRETRKGAAPTLNGAALLDAYERKEITREQYLACTRETRVFDELKARAAIKKDPALLFRLKGAFVPGGQETASIRMRP